MVFLKRLFILSFLLFILSTNTSFGWGREGHAIVARLAFHFLDNNTKQNIKNHLGGMSIEDAAVWMDEVRNNSAYHYMDKWHYIDIDKGSAYHPTSEPNIINALDKVMRELGNKKYVSEIDVNTDILILLHLIGDLHQPLHTGYPGDKGGNSIIISFKNRHTNLHTLWDGILIRNEHITEKACLDLYDTYSATEIKQIQKGTVIDWMYQSRSYLGSVYNFSNNTIDESYEEMSTVVIEKQLLAAGIRLAGLLQKYFGS